MPKLYLTFFILLISQFIQCQERTVSTGGEANGTNGSVSFTIGIIDYTSVNSSDGNITQGIQQPYELFSLSIKENVLNVNISVFPNPVESSLIIELPFISEKEIYAELHDENGKIILKSTLNSGTNQIELETLNPAVYYLNLTDGSESINTYKLIKR